MDAFDPKLSWMDMPGEFMKQFLRLICPTPQQISYDPVLFREKPY